MAGVDDLPVEGHQIEIEDGLLVLLLGREDEVERGEEGQIPRTTRDSNVGNILAGKSSENVDGRSDADLGS